MDDIFSKINHNDKERDEGGNPANNNGDSMQNDQKKPKGRRKTVGKKNHFPPMDFVRAKQCLGIKTSATLEELSFDTVQEKFVMKVMRDCEKQDTRQVHEAYQYLVTKKKKMSGRTMTENWDLTRRKSVGVALLSMATAAAKESEKAEKTDDTDKADNDTEEGQKEAITRQRAKSLSSLVFQAKK